MGCHIPGRPKRLNSAASTAKTLDGAGGGAGGVEEDSGLLGGRTGPRARMRSPGAARGTARNEQHTRRGAFLHFSLEFTMGLSSFFSVTI